MCQRKVCYCKMHDWDHLTHYPFHYLLKFATIRNTELYPGPIHGVTHPEKQIAGKINGWNRFFLCQTLDLLSFIMSLAVAFLGLWIWGDPRAIFRPGPREFITCLKLSSVLKQKGIPCLRHKARKHCYCIKSYFQRMRTKKSQMIGHI